MGKVVALVLLPVVGRVAKQASLYRLEEAVNLTQSLGVDVSFSDLFSVTRPRPSTLMGLGKLEEIAEKVQELEAELVVVDTQLSPIQQRNLEKLLNAKVLDRTGLILEIFGARARTKEGTLQVELAALTYQKSRLVRSWTHLERQRGGLGFIGGPGESQMELDRRMINTRISVIKRDLEKVKKTRQLHRKKREQIPYDVVSLVGYTNAGKSTLFNAMTGAEVLEKDQLFATLDPTLRALELPHGKKVILSDTVGFVSDLPHELVAAFQATLEEVCAAQVILHVHDASNPERQAHEADVNAVLTVLEIEPEDPRILHVYNKIDLLDDAALGDLMSENKGRGAVFVSALKGEFLGQLEKAIEEKLSEGAALASLEVPYEAGEILAWLHRKGRVMTKKKQDDLGVFFLEVELLPKDYAFVKKNYPTYFV